MTALTPCQKCKAERDALRADNAVLTERCYASARRLIESNQETYRLVRDRDRWMKRYDECAALLREASDYMGLDGLEMCDRIMTFLGPEPAALPAVYQPEDT